MGFETILAIATLASIGGTAASLASKPPKPPSLPTPPPIPEPGLDPKESAAASAQALAVRRRRGRASTILTGPAAFGPVSAGQSTKQLLGL